MIVTSVLFTLLHIQGGVPWQSAVAGVLTSALVFAALFLRWRSVPFVLSVHVAMNVMQELVGLRTGGLTLFVPEYSGRLEESESLAVLAITGLVNVAIAVAVFLSASREHKRREHRLKTG